MHTKIIILKLFANSFIVAVLLVGNHILTTYYFPLPLFWGFIGGFGANFHNLSKKSTTFLAALGLFCRKQAETVKILAEIAADPL